MLLGIDIGSSAVKAALVDPEQGVLSTAESAVRLESRQPGWAEADPDEWWQAICDLVPTLLDRSGRNASEVEAVAAAGMVPAVLALDRSGQPLRKAILQNDARATREIEELALALEGIDLLGLTGSVLSQQSVAPTLRWLKRHEPDLFDDTAMVVGSYDWVARRLGAEPHVEQNWAIESGLFTLDGEPLAEALERTDTPAQLFPAVRPPGTVVGEVSAEAASQTGLRTRTPVVVGGADHVSSAYGAGLLAEGDWLVKLGGAGDILVVSKSPLVDERLYLDAHPTGLWLPNGCMASSGSLVRWLQAITGASLEELDEEAASTPAGSGGIVCLPYFLGEKSPLHDPQLRGALVGLHLGHSRGQLFRSVLEAVAFGFRHHVDVFVELGRTSGPCPSHQRRSSLHVVEADSCRRSRRRAIAGTRPSGRLVRRCDRGRSRHRRRPGLGGNRAADPAGPGDRAGRASTSTLRRAVRDLSRARADPAPDLAPTRSG